MWHHEPRRGLDAELGPGGFPEGTGSARGLQQDREAGCGSLSPSGAPPRLLPGENWQKQSSRTFVGVAASRYPGPAGLPSPQTPELVACG